MSALSVTIPLNNGTAIPAVGMGTGCDEEHRKLFKDSLKAAILDAGYRHLDTAWYYGVEELIGEALQDLFDSGKIKREDLFITTKVWPSLWNDPLKSLDKSLHDMHLDYVDLFLQHWPLCFDSGPDGKPECPRNPDGSIKLVKGADHLDTWRKIIDIYKNTGKVRAIGVSNFTPALLDNLIKETGVVPAVDQVELHPHLPQVDLVKYCKEHQIVMEAYSPLGSTGAPNLKIPIVNTLAKKYGVPPIDILVNYHVQAQRVVLPRSQNSERIKKGFALVKLTKEEMDQLDQYGIDNPKRFICDDWGKDLGFEHWD